jgi:hypothetical protein
MKRSPGLVCGGGALQDQLGPATEVAVEEGGEVGAGQW